MPLKSVSISLINRPHKWSTVHADQHVSDATIYATDPLTINLSRLLSTSNRKQLATYRPNRNRKRTNGGQ